MAKPNGVIVYRGPSELDGKPIVAIATGLTRKSENGKTGAMVQVYILADNQLKPLDNATQGGDVSICGACPHRAQDGKLGSCYVNLGQGPGSVYAALSRGSYPSMDIVSHGELFRNRPIRFGAYGDPAAVPLAVWETLARLTTHWTGYTHQWRTCDQRYSQYCMASVESEAMAAQARDKGYRTFRTRLPEEAVGAGEIVCPASGEAGKRRTCETCRACHGAGSGRSITILVHGFAWKEAKYRRALALVN